MRRKGLMTKLVILAVIITSTSLVAFFKSYSPNGVIANRFSNSDNNVMTANPNPFKDFTVITVNFDDPIQGSLIIEDSDGRFIAEIHRGFFDGTMDFVWDGTDGHGKRLPKGTYHAHLNTNNQGNRYTSRTIILILK